MSLYGEFQENGDVYEKCKASGIPVDSHESDLYIPVTPETTALIDKYPFKSNVKTFRSQIDGALWYDIPFGYTPFWEARLVGKEG